MSSRKWEQRREENQRTLKIFFQNGRTWISRLKKPSKYPEQKMKVTHMKACHWNFRDWEWRENPKNLKEKKKARSQDETRMTSVVRMEQSLQNS